MILKLYNLFGLAGFLSVAAWVAALFFCARGLLGAPVARRGRRLALAAAAALVGLLFAEWTAARVGEYRLDRGEEIRAAREAQQRLEAQEEALRRQSGEVGVRFAEDAPGESVAGSVSPAGAEPEYRKRGKQRREQGRQDQTNAVLARQAQDAGPGGQPAVALKLPEYLLANRFSRLNLLLARMVLLAMIGVLVGDYLRRFHQTFGRPFPLPIAGRWLDGFSPKSHSVLWAGADAAEVRGLLDVIVRRGESFVYFGDRAVTGGGAFWRLRAGRYGLFPLPMVACGEEGMTEDPEFLLDAAWFSRHAVRVGCGAGPADALAGMARVLVERARVRARARRTLWLLWDTGEIPPADLLSRLPGLCRETNSKLVLIAGTQSMAGAGVCFEEVRVPGACKLSGWKGSRG